LQLFFDFFSKI